MFHTNKSLLGSTTGVVGVPAAGGGVTLGLEQPTDKDNTIVSTINIDTTLFNIKSLQIIYVFAVNKH